MGANLNEAGQSSEREGGQRVELTFETFCEVYSELMLTTGRRRERKQAIGGLFKPSDLVNSELRRTNDRIQHSQKKRRIPIQSSPRLLQVPLLSLSRP